MDLKELEELRSFYSGHFDHMPVKKALRDIHRLLDEAYTLKVTESLLRDVERERDEARATKDMHKERQQDLELEVEVLNRYIREHEI